VEQCFQQVNTCHAVPWAGLRPMMPRMLPRVGTGRKANVLYNTGHGHLGWTLSAITADMVGEVIAEAHPGRQGFNGFRGEWHRSQLEILPPP
jgi:D-amino-acid dehydrogenase